MAAAERQVAPREDSSSLIYWAGCTGNGVVATGTTGQTSYGGLSIANSGNLGAFDAFKGTLQSHTHGAPFSARRACVRGVDLTPRGGR